MGSWPARRRANAASALGENAVRAVACSMVGGQGRSLVAPQAEMAVRSASIGLVAVGSARRTVITVGGMTAVGRWWVGSHSPDQSRFAMAG